MQKTILLLLIGIVSFGQSIAQKNLKLSGNHVIGLDSIATQDVPPNAPGIATGIVKNGKVVYLKYAGYANLEDSVLIDSKSRFNIASNGKQFTALAILMLVESQKLKLTDDFRKYLPDILPNVKAKITIENLINHSSGIRDVYDLWSLQNITWWKKELSNKDALQLLRKQTELNFEVGTKHLYSNSNYILLAQIIEKVNPNGFVAFTSQMFKQLQMPNTSFTEDYKNIDGAIAKPYFNFGKWTGYNWTCNIRGDGNLFSTIDDQLQWEKLIQTNGGGLISEKIIKKTQQLTANPNIKSYGYGVEFATYKDLNYRFHEGATGAWKATFVRFPEDTLSMVTLTNSGKTIPSMQTRQMVDFVYGFTNKTPKYAILPPKVGSYTSEKDILGTYQTPDGFTFRFEERGTDIYLIRIGRNDIKLKREADNIFYQSNDRDFKQEFTKNTSGQMQVTVYYPTHAPYTLTRIDADWQGFDFGSLNGVFLNQETGVKMSIEHQKDKTYKVMLGNETSTGLLLSPTKLLVDNYNIKIQSQKKELLLNGDRIKNVRFKHLK
ncbi:MAG: serine hydrolase domain-containing protein [Spirosomataceae bacterium]